jgi:hypothetical protein
LKTCISSFLPDSETTNFVSTIGCGCLNGNENGVAQILECSFSDKNEPIRTVVHQINRLGSTFKINSFKINNRDFISHIRINWSKLEIYKKYTFSEIKEKLSEDLTGERDKEGHLTDDEILITLLNNSYAFKIFKNSSQNYFDWQFTVMQ